MSLREGLRTLGSRAFIVLAIIVTLDNLQSSGLAVLAPNIQSSFHVSTGAITFVAGIAGGFLVLGIVPMGWLADRFRRAPIIGWATFAFGLMVFVSGLGDQHLRVLPGALRRRHLPSQHQQRPRLSAGGHLPDQRARAACTRPWGWAAARPWPSARCWSASSPRRWAVPNGWRWAFYILAIPIVVVAVFAFRIPEPPRGQFEKKDVLGEVFSDARPAAPSLEAAFERIMRIRTIKMVLIAFSAIGFGLFTVPVLGNLYLKQRFGLDAFQRGMIGTIGSVGVLVALPLVGRYYDRLYRKDPARALSLIGKVVLPCAVLVPIQYFMPNAVLWAIFSVPTAVLLLTGFSMIGPVLTSVAPYRLRGLVGAVGGIYVFFVGATGGAVLAALLDSVVGMRATVLIIMIPSTIFGAIMIIRSAHFIRNDLSLVVVELQEEQEEHKRQEADPGADPGPAAEQRRLQLRARPDPLRRQLRGETGRGARTARDERRREVDGAATSRPAWRSRRVARSGSTGGTSPTPRRSSGRGSASICCPGGKGVFGPMTVAENLEMGGFVYRSDRAELRRRTERVYELFPAIKDRRGERADSLSGGQQQMLALAIAMLHDPAVLMIDELSLGLAPIIVQELIEVVDGLKAAGVTLIIVEQSLNVAAAIADRAVFLEKGRVRFEGQIRDLMERDDLARAVFLGGQEDA